MLVSVRLLVGACSSMPALILAADNCACSMLQQVPRVVTTAEDALRLVSRSMRWAAASTPRAQQQSLAQRGGGGGGQQPPQGSAPYPTISALRVRLCVPSALHVIGIRARHALCVLAPLATASPSRYLLQQKC